MRKPNFFVIGAPRAGTTSLCTYLADHPLIYFSRVKEPSFFSTDYPDLRRAAQREYENYDDLFAGATDEHLAVGEGSTSYLSSRLAVPKILEYNPNARFIVLLRHPADLAFSRHSSNVYHNNDDVEDFEEAWRLQWERACGRHMPPRCEDPLLVQYSKLYQLGAQMERLYTHVSSDRVLVHFFEDLANDPLQVYERTLTFLGVPSNRRMSFPVINQSRRRRSRTADKVLVLLSKLRALAVRRSLGIGSMLEKANSSPHSFRGLSPEFRSDLIEHFAGDIRQLSKITGRDLASWLK